MRKSMQIYNDKKEKVAVIDGFKNRSITKTLSTGDQELYFEYPAGGKWEEELKEEHYVRTEEEEYVIKQIERGEEFVKYTAAINVEDLEAAGFPGGFESKTKTIRECLQTAFAGTGWKIGECQGTKRRTVRKEEKTTAWEVLQDALNTYRCECVIHSLTKTVDIYDKIGEDRGAYFIEGLNLRRLSIKSDTYDFYTRIHPIGKDGLELSGEKKYLEDTSFSKKIKTYEWKDERYTDEESLREDALEKLQEMSRPYITYEVDIVDLAEISEKYKSILDYKIGDEITLISKSKKIKEKQRIVKIVEYDDPSKNTAELSSTRQTFAQVQDAITQQAKEEAKDEAVDETKEYLENYYSKTEEIEVKIESTKESIELEVLSTLEGYYDKEETDARIGISKGEIELEVSKTYQTKDDMGNYYTQSETKSLIDLAVDEIELSVSQTYQTKDDMGNYYTQKETQSRIDLAVEGVELSVSNTYQTKSAMSNYYTQNETKAQIKLVTDEISSEVSKKVGADEFGTKISQNAYYVRVAWNGNSKYIQFEDGSIVVYDGETTTNKKRAAFDYNGNHFYRDGYYVGKIGTNYWISNSAHKGLVIDLAYQGKYIAFGQAAYSGDDFHTMLTFSRANSIYSTYGIHAGCDLDMHNFKIKNMQFENGVTATMNFVQITEIGSDGSIKSWGDDAMLEFKNGILTNIKYYVKN